MAAYHHVATIATHPVPGSFNMVVISGSPWRIGPASRPFVEESVKSLKYECLVRFLFSSAHSIPPIDK
jgi:hypothetical protein